MVNRKEGLSIRCQVQPGKCEPEQFLLQTAW